MGRPRKEHVNTGKHSLNEDRSNANGEMRSKSTVRRLKMYRNAKERRNAIGKIVKDAPFQSTVESGKMVRIEPNRKWFGNTRVITDKDLIKLQEYQTTYDPFQLKLRSSLLPLSLNKAKMKKNKPDFENLQPYLKRKIHRSEGNAIANSFEELSAQTKLHLEAFNAKQETVQDELKSEAIHGVFRAGTSNRIWQELMKVIDSSDVLLYVLDARNPLAMRSKMIENDVRNKGKSLIYVLNKVDLVPSRISLHWEKELNKEFPTVMFYADWKHPLGKYRLINVLRQIRDKLRDRRQISVGVIGFPNTGKSSLINALRGEKVCKVAPIAGETKVWQYITLLKSINLIDCPGTVSADRLEKLSETDLILRNSIRVEKVDDADRHIPAVIDIVGIDILQRHYKLKRPWTSSEQFLEMVARNRGRLLKGGQPDVLSVAKEVLKDFNTGKLLWFIKPPGYDESQKDSSNFDNKVWLKNQRTKEEVENKELVKTKDLDDIPRAEEAMVVENDEEEDGEKSEESSGEEMYEDISEDVKPKPKKVSLMETGENDAGVSFKKKTQQSKVATKLSCKERRKLERAVREKKTGVHYYNVVDSKMRRTKF